MKVLVVDDSTIMRMAIEKGLSISGFEVVGQAENGVEALKLFKEKKPELVTMDITMPQMDGLTCIEEMIKIDSNIKIIVVTALTKDGIALKALSRGARGFVNKPFTVDKLKEAIDRIGSD